MADPTKYTVSYNFSNWQATNPTKPLPAQRVDIELANIATSVGQTIDGLKDIRRSDGKLANGSVGPDQLSPALNIGFTVRGEWAVGQNYSSGDGVVYDQKFYSARVQHVSTNANRPDLDSVTWLYLFSVGDFVIPDDSIDSIKLTDAASKEKVVRVPDRTTLKALDTSRYSIAYLEENGREGHFIWRTGNYASVIASDTTEGLYVKADSVAAATGAWVRSFSGDVNVKWFGAKGDTVTLDSTAFIKALAHSKNVYAPAGTYNAGEINIPSNAVLRGDGKGLTVLRPLSTAQYVVGLTGSGARLADIGVNGNLMAGDGIRTTADYCQISQVHSQFNTWCGFKFNGADTWDLTDTSSDNNPHSIYVEERGINCTITRHFSRGADVYGFRGTYTTQEAQAIRFIACCFFGNQFGIVFEKKAFSINIVDCIIDGCTNTGIRLADLTEFNTSTDFYIERNFIYADQTPIYIGAGNDHVVIHANTIAEGAVRNLWVHAAAGIYCRNVIISENNFGNPDNGDILIDSVRHCVIENNQFGQAGSGYSVDFANTVSGAPAAILSKNFFQRANPVQTGTGNPINADRNIGFKTEAQATGTMPSGQTSVVINHGLAVVPSFVSVTEQGNFGAVFVTAISNTQFTVNFGSAPPANWPFLWKAEALKA